MHCRSCHLPCFCHRPNVWYGRQKGWEWLGEMHRLWSMSDLEVGQRTLEVIQQLNMEGAVDHSKWRKLGKDIV